MTWQLDWEHTPMLAEDAHGTCNAGLAEVSRRDATVRPPAGHVGPGPARCWRYLRLP